MPENSDQFRERVEQDQNLNRLLDRMFGDQPGDARELLCRMTEKWDAEDDGGSAEAIRLYAGMASSLSEEDFRWCASAAVDRKKLRKERLAQYGRFRELFEMEIRTGLKIRRSAMAVGADWSSMGVYCRDWVTMMRAHLLLRMAGWLFRWHIPGAADLCDAVAFGMYESVYGAA